MKLYELSQNFNNLYDLLENEEVPVEVVEQALKEIEDSIDTKFENIAKLIKVFESKIDAFKLEEKRMKERRKVYENRITSLKDYMLNQLEFMGRKKVEAGLFTVRRQKNPKSIDVYDKNKLSDDYLIPQEPKVNTRAIRDVMKEGKEVEGVRYKPESYHIRIQ